MQIDRETVGMIVRLERETLEVLNMYGKVYNQIFFHNNSVPVGAIKTFGNYG